MSRYFFKEITVQISWFGILHPKYGGWSYAALATGSSDYG
jgi:hypothetical protein